MKIGFGAPLALALLALIPLAFWSSRGRLRRFSAGRRAVVLGLRCAMLLALILALTEPRLGRPDDRLSVILAVDTSASVQAPQQEAERRWVRQAEAIAGPNDQLAVVEFGRWAALSDPAGAAAVPPDATNLSDALDLGASLLTGGGRKRIVLITDGQQNIGRAQDRALGLAGRGIEVSFVRPEPELVTADVVLRRLDAPAYLREGETLLAEAVVASTHSMTALVTLFVDGQVVSERLLDLQPGSQRVPLAARLGQVGAHRLRAEVQAAGDALSTNNDAEAVTIVKEAGRVLLLESRNGEAMPLAEALQSAGLRPEIRPVATVPPSAAQLEDFQTIVLVNVPNTALTLDQQATLQSFVRDAGRGLVVAGGNTSYALGAYQNTPLGDLLPVDPTPPARRELGSVALVLVIDKSGSMDLYRRDVSKMAMAREAAMLATDALNLDDQVGVIAFDSRFDWVVPLARLQGPADANLIRSRIASIQADGGTNIYPALEAAYQAVSAAQARIRHVVLLTDGQSADGDYASLLARMKPRNITLTTIGIGSDADANLLTRLALLGDGRYYFTERPEEIPKLVTRETTIVSRNPLIEGLIRPRPAEPSALLADLSGKEVPPLNGYIATTARPQADTILTSDRGDPILASWQYGLGRVVAWTSDASPAWAGAWLDSPDARRVWGQAVRWAMPQPTEPGFQLSTAVERDQVALTVQANQQDGSFAEGRDIRATVTTSSGQALEVPLRQNGPGNYGIEVQVADPGAYTVRVEELRNGVAVRSESGGFVVAGEPELRTLGPNRALLGQLAQATGGRELTEPGDALRRQGSPPDTRWDPLWPWLIALALVLLPFDVAARRLSLFRR